MIMTAVVTVICAYLIGSVNFAVIFTRAFTKEDVRNFGSGNAGTTNVMRVGGFLPGALTFVCDALKGFAACMIGKLMFDYIGTQGSAVWAMPIYGAYLCGVACMLGHVFPVFFQFKGGKGVATSVGIFAVCSPLSLIIGLTVFAILVLSTRIVSVSSLTATAVAIILSIAVFYTRTALLWPQAVLSITMGVTVFLKHSENIKRLIAGEEKKLNIRRGR